MKWNKGGEQDVKGEKDVIESEDIKCGALERGTGM
jgi:hypothetical protein